MKSGRVRPEILLVAAAVAGSFLVYLPFLGQMAEVYRFWDGPNYLTIARTLYDVKPDNPLLAYVHEPRYFLVHLPMYPLAVRALVKTAWSAEAAARTVAHDGPVYERPFARPAEQDARRYHAHDVGEAAAHQQRGQRQPLRAGLEPPPARIERA